MFLYYPSKIPPVLLPLEVYSAIICIPPKRFLIKQSLYCGRWAIVLFFVQQINSSAYSFRLIDIFSFTIIFKYFLIRITYTNAYLIAPWVICWSAQLLCHLFHLSFLSGIIILYILSGKSQVKNYSAIYLLVLFLLPTRSIQCYNLYAHLLSSVESS